MNNEIMFRFGWLAPTFEEQANEQGYTLGDKADYYNSILKAYLKLRDYMTDKQEESIRNKIGKDLTKHLVPLEEEVQNDSL